MRARAGIGSDSHRASFHSKRNVGHSARPNRLDASVLRRSQAGHVEESRLRTGGHDDFRRSGSAGLRDRSQPSGRRGGERTFGLASEQKLITLDDGAALILTVANYYNA